MIAASAVNFLKCKQGCVIASGDAQLIVAGKYLQERALLDFINTKYPKLIR